MMTFDEAIREFIELYAPVGEAEETDRAQMLAFWRRNPDAFYRENPMAHFTASTWIVDADRRSALMVYHNIFRSWSWTGGHADGEADLRMVAMREAEEETGARVRLISDTPISIESINVVPHIKRNRYVSAHVHMNVTFLVEADVSAPLRVKDDENSGVMWIPFEKIGEMCSEPEMMPIYEKLMDRSRV